MATGAGDGESTASFLRGVALFAELTEDLRHELALAAERVDLPAGEWLFRQGDPASRARFQGLLGTPQAQSALAELGSRAQHERVALLCFERGVDCCHRRLVTEHLLSRDPGLAVRHL